MQQQAPSAEDLLPGFQLAKKGPCVPQCLPEETVVVEEEEEEAEVGAVGEPFVPLVWTGEYLQRNIQNPFATQLVSPVNSLELRQRLRSLGTAQFVCASLALHIVRRNLAQCWPESIGDCMPLYFVTT